MTAVQRRSRSYHDVDYADIGNWNKQILHNLKLNDYERQHLKGVMLRDQEVKKEDIERILHLTNNFPTNMRPELLSKRVAHMKDQYPPCPGSGHVSLSKPITLMKFDTGGNVVTRNWQTAYRNSQQLLPSQTKESTNIGADWERPQKSKPFKNQCPICHQKYCTICTDPKCVKCQRRICPHCAQQIKSEEELSVCRTCHDYGLLAQRTGDWFVQYLTVRPANPLNDPSIDTGKYRSTSPVPPYSMAHVAAQPLMMASIQPEVAANQHAVATRSMSRSRSPTYVSSYRVSNPDSNYYSRGRTDSPRRYSMPQVQSTQSNVVVNNAAFNFADLPPALVEHDEYDDQFSWGSSTSSPGPVTEDASQQRRGHLRRRIRSKLHSIHHQNDSDSETAHKTPPTIQGYLESSVNYEPQSHALTVMLWSAYDVPDRSRGSSTPYVKVYLLPEGATSKKRIFCRGHTPTPEFNQSVTFTVPPTEVRQKTVILELHNKRQTKGGSGMFLGQTSIPLANYPWNDQEPRRHELRRTLSIPPDRQSTSYAMTVPSSAPPSNQLDAGQLIVLSVQFNTLVGQQRRRLHDGNRGLLTGGGPVDCLEVFVKEARNLQSYSSPGVINAFVTVSLIHRRLREQRTTPNQKPEIQTVKQLSTDVIVNSSSPVWKRLLRLDQIDHLTMFNAALELAVWNKIGQGKPDELLGSVRLMTNDYENDVARTYRWTLMNRREVELWQAVINEPNVWIESSLPLHPLYL